MTSKELRFMLSQIAVRHGFAAAHGGWFLTSAECIVVLDLQRATDGNSHQLLTKVYVQGAFAGRHTVSKSLRNDTGDVFFGVPREWSTLFDGDSDLAAALRNDRLDELFATVVVPAARKSLSRAGLFELEAQRRLSLLPAVRAELLRLLAQED